jgi:hypothetical protein
MTVEHPPKAKAAVTHASARRIASSPVTPKNNVIENDEYGNALRLNGD